MKNKKGKVTGVGIGIGVVIVLLVVMIAGFATNWFGMSKGTSQNAINPTPSPSTSQNNAGGSPTQCNVVPTYTYSAKDAFATTLIGGTDQIKQGSDSPVTSLANPTFGAKLQYWKSNSTFFVAPESRDQVFCGANSIQAKAYANASTTLKVWDSDNNAFLTSGGGATNVTIGANGVSNLEFRYQGTAKQSAMPFGGCIAVEVPSTITDIALSGTGVGDPVGGALFGGSISSAKPCPYTWTYTVSSTSNTYKLYEVPAGFDIAGLGDLKKMSLQLKAGSSNPSGTAYVSYQPASYYVGNDGNLYLGIEKDKNADTTKTFAGGGTFSFVIM